MEYRIIKQVTESGKEYFYIQYKHFLIRNYVKTACTEFGPPVTFSKTVFNSLNACEKYIKDRQIKHKEIIYLSKN